MARTLLLFLILTLGTAANANDNIFRLPIQGSMESVYQELYNLLEEQKLFVVFEANIGRNLSRFKTSWGEDYNRNKLDGIRSMVFCNPWYANQVSNKDPNMLALCPMHLTLVHKNGMTTILFARPTVTAAGSAAEPILQELEQKIIDIIRKLAT